MFYNLVVLPMFYVHVTCVIDDDEINRDNKNRDT